MAWRKTTSHWGCRGIFVRIVPSGRKLVTMKVAQIFFQNSGGLIVNNCSPHWFFNNCSQLLLEFISKSDSLSAHISIWEKTTNGAVFFNKICQVPMPHPNWRGFPIKFNWQISSVRKVLIQIIRFFGYAQWPKSNAKFDIFSFLMQSLYSLWIFSLDWRNP